MTRPQPDANGLSSSSSYPPFQGGEPVPDRYRFSYPNTLLPVPYHTNTSLQYLSSFVIPFARSSRLVPVDIPSSLVNVLSSVGAGMDVDTAVGLPPSQPTPSQLMSTPVNINADGLLLYVAQASYEPGTSPLSSWIPSRGDGGNPSSALDLFER